MISLLTVAILATTPIRLEEVRSVSRENARAQRAQMDVRRAEQQLRLARSSVLPQVALGAALTGAYRGTDRTVQSVPAPGPGGTITRVEETVEIPASTSAGLDLSASLNQSVYDASHWAQIGRAGSLEQAAAGQSEEQRLTSEYEGIRRFYALYREQEAVRVLEATVVRSREQVDRAQAMFEAGRSPKTELVQAQVNLGNDQIAVLRERNQLIAAQSDLASWVDRPGSTDLEAVPPALPPTPAPAGIELSEAITRAREHRPALRALDLQVQAAEQAMRAARAGDYPRLGLQLRYDHNGPNYSSTLDKAPSRDTVTGGLNLTWDVFTGFATRASVAEAFWAASQLKLDLALAERDLSGEVRKAVLGLTLQLSATEVARSNRATAESGLRLANERFSAGVGSTLEVRDAQLKLTQAELALLQNRIDAELARAALYRAMGSFE